MFTEKHQAFHIATTAVADVNTAIERLREQFKSDMESLEHQLAISTDYLNAAASEAAEEKLAAGLAAIEMPDGSFRLCQKARRGKKTADSPDGTPPRHPYVVSDKILRT